jgi:hypothetical protein
MHRVHIRMYIHTFMLTQQRPKDTKDIKRHIQRLQYIGCRARFWLIQTPWHADLTLGLWSQGLPRYVRARGKGGLEEEEGSTRGRPE